MKNKQYLLESLLSTSMVGLLILSSLSVVNLFGATIQKDSSMQTDEKSTFINADDSSVQIMPDGTKIIKGSDNSIVQIKPDGSKIIKKADGTAVEINSDGSKRIKNADGTTIEIKSDKQLNK